MVNEQRTKALMLFMLNIFLVCMIVFGLGALNVLNVDEIVNSNIVLAVGLGCGAGALILYERKKIQQGFEIEKKKGFGVFWDIVPYLFLVILGVLALNQYFKWDFVNDQSLRLVILGVVFGGLTFWHNRDRIEKEIEDEKSKEELAEKTRYDEFDSKFPKLKWFDFSYGVGLAFKQKSWFKGILRIIASPFVWLARLPYSFVRWMYGEGWWYSGALIVIVLIGFVLRVWNLQFTPYIDEYPHIVSAINLEKGILDYPRSQILTIIVSITRSLFGLNNIILSSRLALSFLSIMAIFPIYLLFKNSSKKISLLTAFWIAITPWAIWLSRYIREYSIFPLIFFLIILYFEKNKIITEKNKKTYLLKGLVPIFIITIYSLFIDKQSTFKFLLILIFPLFLMNTFGNIKVKNNKSLFLISSIILSLSILLIFFIYHASYIGLKLDITWLKFIFSNSQYFAWFEPSFKNYFSIFFSALGIIGLTLQRRKFPKKILLVLLIILTFYTFAFDRYFKPRYISYTLPFVLFILSYGIIFVYGLIRTNKFISSKTGIILILLMLSAFINIGSIQKSVTWNESGYNPYSGEYHDRIPDEIKYIDNGQIYRSDKIITGTPYLISYILGEPINHTKIEKYDYQDTLRFEKINETILKNSEGYIIIDWRRNSRWSEGLPLKNFTIYNGSSSKKVMLIDSDNWLVYKWRD